MVDSCHGVQDSFFDRFCSLGFFNTKDQETNRPPILTDGLSHSTVPNSGIIGNGHDSSMDNRRTNDNDTPVVNQKSTSTCAGTSGINKSSSSPIGNNRSNQLDVDFPMKEDARQPAKGIPYLPQGTTVQSENSQVKNLSGLVVREPLPGWVTRETWAELIPSHVTLGLSAVVRQRLIINLAKSNQLMREWSGSGETGGEPGLISYQPGINGFQEETIVFQWKDCNDLHNVRLGTKVVFDVHQVGQIAQVMAANIRSDNEEHFGESGDDELRLSKSQNLTQKPPDGQIAEEMSPVWEDSGDVNSNSSPSADSESSSNDNLVTSFSESVMSSSCDEFDLEIPPDSEDLNEAEIICEPEIHEVVRPVRGERKESIENGHCHSSGVIGNGHVVQTDEVLVKLQVDVVKLNLDRKKLRAKVETVKGFYGFLSYEAEDGRKLYFHSSEVKGSVQLKPGDQVEFFIHQHPRSGKLSACSVVKVTETQTQRPERMSKRFVQVAVVDESVARTIVIRQPYGPDGTRGFNKPRLPRIPGVL